MNQQSDLSEFVADPDENPFGTEIPHDLPMMTYYYCLVMPVRPVKKSAGGIIIPDSAQDTQDYVNSFGILVAKGPAAFRSPRLYPGLEKEEIANDPSVSPRVGDWVLWGRNSATGITYGGVKFKVITDQAIIAVLPDPSLIQVKV